MYTQRKLLLMHELAQLSDSKVYYASYTSWAHKNKH